MARRYRIEDMALLFAERERDGVSIAELGRRTGICRKTLYRWNRELSDGHESKFVEAEIVDGVEEPKSPPSTLSIRIGRATIDFDGATVDRTALETVVSVLAARC